ncbi:hypothetical protein A4D02_26560 [Niastella koreensis]|uniref:Uncharacterized protein n=2 Tax=Niastella koreensis TaxID=354356 RepID=G8TEI0_NIAKG|nr:hypothetical protein [Niastella koreensis]AEV99402.1 hypothetical protein Niako_3072 [Niastella koreensis GR20-10]OQP50005.1 hypothetical protein A4D02_26560 [Niastella koreensis]
MKKWKVIFISIAIVVGIGGAYASYKQDGICSFYIQYRYTGGTYVPAGEEGIDYACVGGIGICTYYQPSPSSGYLPCHFGFYTPLGDELKAKK